MRTYILEWNPATSPMTEKDILRAIPCPEWEDFHFTLPGRMTTARSGDNFYLLRVGAAPEGIVGKGFFLSDPEEIPGTESFTINVRPTFMVSWEHPQGLLPFDELRTSIDRIDREAQDSCIQLSPEEADTLSSLWNGYLSRFTEEDFSGSLSTGLLGRRERPDAILDDALILTADALYEQTDCDGNPLILKAMKLAGSWKTPRYMSISLLHYASLYSEFDAGRIRDKGFPEDIVDTICILKHNPEMEIRDYILNLTRLNNLRASKIAVKDLELNHADWLIEHGAESSGLLYDFYRTAGIAMET